MKQILIIADGILARNFLRRIYKIKNIIHKYTIISQNPQNSVPNELYESEIFEIHNFDATSKEKLKIVLEKQNFDQCILVSDNEFDTKITYENLKQIAPEMELYVVDRFGTFANSENKKDEHTKTINSLSLISSRLVGFLPDSPVFADNIGIGKGEIMEVKIPIASSFAYKKVGLLTTSKFQIPMIYRHNRYIVTNYDTMVFPNDTILLVGEPSALRSVYSAIKEENGQFPSPFGVNICTFIDMKILNENEISHIINVGISLNKTLKSHKFFIKIINPTISENLNKLKELQDSENCEISIDYTNKFFGDFKDSIEKHKIGLILSTNEFFEIYKNAFYRSNCPILTLGKCKLNEISKAVIVTNGENVTEESSIVFDVASQLNLDIFLYYFNQNSVKDDKFITNYKNLATLFKNDLHIIDEWSKNPILALEKEQNFLQFLPFSEKILKRNLGSAFAKDLDLMYFKLKNNYQLFVPIDFKYENY